MAEDRKHFDRKIDLLEDQIHTINVKLNQPEKKSWWGRNSSLVISLVALLASLIFSIRSIVTENEKEDLSKKSQRIARISELALKIADLEEKNYRLAADNLNVNTQAVSVIYNYQRLFYLEELLDLMDQDRNGFPPDLYSLIGNQLKVDGELKKAKEYYLLGVKHADRPQSKVVAFRDVAAVYGIPDNPIFNQDSSRFYWGESVKANLELMGEKSWEYLGYTYQMWAASEFYAGNTKFATNLIDSAKKAYQNLNEANSNMHGYMSQLQQMVQYYGNKDISNLFFNLSGKWEVQESNEVIGHAYFFQNANGWNCTVEITRGGILEMYLAGAMVGVAENHINFGLSGVKKFNTQYGDRLPFNGSMRFYPKGDQASVLYAQIFELNSLTRNVALRKV